MLAATVASTELVRSGTPDFPCTLHLGSVSRRTVQWGKCLFVCIVRGRLPSYWAQSEQRCHRRGPIQFQE